MVAVRGKYVSSQNIPFGVAWKELKKQGWTSVRPRAKDLDPRWKYVRPGGHVNGTKGIDFLLGEEELLDAADGSEPDPERDEMDIALAKEFLDGFGGTDAVLADHFRDSAEFGSAELAHNPVPSTKGWTTARERFYRSPSAEAAQLEVLRHPGYPTYRPAEYAGLSFARSETLSYPDRPNLLALPVNTLQAMPLEY
ncbi:hypothetical protein PInf_028921 [Phytophthora infestans]|nr:hypothetical protein PInf_028921 [Phytophthora infestans]